MTYRKVDYFEAARILPPGRGCVLADFDARLVPVTLSALETRKGRSFWSDSDDWSEALTELCRAQEALLMSCRDDIIQEIRHLRGSVPPNVPTDLQAYPVGTYPGIQIADVVGSLNTNGESAARILADIRGILQTQGAGEQGQLDALLQIVALLSV